MRTIFTFLKVSKFLRKYKPYHSISGKRESKAYNHAVSKLQKADGLIDAR